MAHKYNEDEVVKSINFSMLRRSFSYLKPYPFSFFFLFLFGAISTVCFLFFTKVLGNTLDLLLASTDKSFLPRIVFELFLFLLLGSLFQFLRGKLLIQTKIKISIQFQNDILSKLDCLPQEYYDNTPHGKIYTRVSHYVDHIIYVLCEVLLDFLLQIITFIIVFIFLISLNVKLTIMTFFLVLLFFLFYVFLTPKWLKIQKAFQNKETNANAYLSETLKGVKVTQAFLRESKNREMYSSLIQDVYRAKIPNSYLGNLSWSLGYIFEMITTILVYVLGFFFFYPSLSIGSIIIFGSYTSYFWDPIAHITSLYDSIIQAIDYLERIYDLLDYPEEKNPTSVYTITSGNVVFDHVSFSYVKDKEVLHDVSFSIPSGTKVAIVGHTGSGKSTIIQLLTKLYEQEKGIILVDNMDIQKMSLESLRSSVMMMSQDGYLFSKSIYENLVLSKKDVSLQEVRRICKKIHIDDFIMKLPNGYDTLVEGNGISFSTGQKQMLSIARILIQNPKIAILDEATSNVDVLTEQAVVDTFFEVFEGKTTIVIAHRLSTIVNSDLIFVMDHGSLVESGTHDELLENKGKYFELYTAQTCDVLK